MKLLSDWGFTRQGLLTGERGEYLTLLQGLLLGGFVLLPVYPAIALSPPLTYFLWGIAGCLLLISFIFLGKGLIDLGQNLTPLPYPKPDGNLVQTGVYGVVRHPLYSGLLFAALAWSIGQFSLSHLIATGILFTFFNIKGSREESWLTEKYSEYPDYQQRVKMLIPWIY